ncbi:MAG: metallophosphoesterase, partial [Elusimicrobiaceae bacterium]|nr:metallophosphoesterase [Elusimicrobiaceae bacterium]
VAAKYQVPLMLSGHTHNGQIFPFNFFVKLKYKYVYGWYDLAENSKLYVTSGMFYWGMPLRFLTSSEIPLLHIKSHD